jgi:hypothetical protein
MCDLQIARRAVDAQFSDCTFWHFLAPWRKLPTSVHRCKSTADRSRFGYIPVLGLKGRNKIAQRQRLGFPTRICSSSFWLLPLIRVVRASALVAPTKMICKSYDPVAKRKKNSFVPSAGNRILRPDSHPPSARPKVCCSARVSGTRRVAAVRPTEGLRFSSVLRPPSSILISSSPRLASFANSSHVVKCHFVFVF